jgi:hypothetical protein
MLKAWVLIQTEVGRAGEVAAAVTAIDGVELSEVTAARSTSSPRFRPPTWTPWAG